MNRRQFLPHLAALPALAVGVSVPSERGASTELVMVGHEPQEFPELMPTNDVVVSRHPAVAHLVAVLQAADRVASPELSRLLEGAIGTIECSLPEADIDRMTRQMAPRLTADNALVAIRKAAEYLLTHHGCSGRGFLANQCDACDQAFGLVCLAKLVHGR